MDLSVSIASRKFTDDIAARPLPPGRCAARGAQRERRGNRSRTRGDAVSGRLRAETMALSIKNAGRGNLRCSADFHAESGCCGSSLDGTAFFLVKILPGIKNTFSRGEDRQTEEQ
jgi:hypothetical protein